MTHKNLTKTIKTRKDYLENAEYQEQAMKEIEALESITNSHVFRMVLGDHGSIDITDPAFLNVTDPNYIPPSKNLIRDVVELIMSRGYTKTELGEMLGVSTVKNRTINNWITESKDTKIPYCAWLTLTNLAGITITTMLMPESDI